MGLFFRSDRSWLTVDTQYLFIKRRKRGRERESTLVKKSEMGKSKPGEKNKYEGSGARKTH